MKVWHLIICGAVIFLYLTSCSRSESNQLVTSKPAPVEPVQSDSVVGEQPTHTGTPNKEQMEPTQVKFAQLENVFGIADETGKRLITLQYNYNMSLLKPEQFQVAIGNNGEWIELEFVSWQDSSEQDNGRQTMYNFNHMAGYVYKVKNGELSPNKAYFLTRADVVNKEHLIRLESTKATDLQYKQVNAELITQIENIKNRKVSLGYLLTESSEESVGMFIFEREEDNMLASIAYIKGEAVLFKDIPAIYNESGTWRVDSGDDPGLFEVLFIAHSDEGLLLGLSWGAVEGEILFILKEVNGVLQDTNLTSGRYWAPL